MFPHSHRFTEETRSSFIRAHSPDSEHRDQVVLPVIERSEFQDNATLLICHPASSHVNKIKEKAESTDRGAQTEQHFLVSGNSTQVEIKDGTSPGSQVNMSCDVQHKDGSKLCQKRESQTANSGNIQSILRSSATRQESGLVESEQVLGVSTGQRSSREQEQNGGLTTVNLNTGGCSKASSKGKQEGSHLLLQLSINSTSSEKKSDSFVSLCDDTTNTSCPDSGAEQFVEKYSDNTLNIQETGPLPLDVNQDILVKDQMEGFHPVKNTQEVDHHTEQSLMEHETDLGDMFVVTGRSEEAHSNAVHQRDISPATQLGDDDNVGEGPDSSAEFEEIGGSGRLLIPPADSLDSTSTGKHCFSCEF